MSDPSPSSPDHPALRISDAEWTVMRVLWQRQSATANEVVADLEAETDWNPRTIQTLLRRLVKKGALTYRKQGREFLYRPAIDEASCQQVAGESFLSRVFEGRLAPFVARFVESENLSDEEIEELKRILDKGRPKKP